MSTILSKMKNDMIKYADIMSKIVGVNVEIVDNDLQPLSEKPGAVKNRIIMGNIQREVLKTGVKQVVWEPGKHPLCMGCSEIDQCHEKFELSIPIILEDITIGIIGFVCYTDEQKSNIEKNYITLESFLEEMANLISSKAAEMKESELTKAFAETMNLVINRIDDAVVVFGHNWKVKRMNAVAKALFEHDDDDFTGIELKISLIDEQTDESQDFSIHDGKKKYLVWGQKFKLHNELYEDVFIFKDSNVMKEKAMAVVSSNERIGIDRLLGVSYPMGVLKKTIMTIAATSSSVIIRGESGTGKELIARALHEEGDRVNHPFVAINCGAIPENLLESELFGYVKGAFTGADPKGKMGKFELANKGTLFLDEIGDMPLHIQVKLLRVLEERKIVKLGATNPIKIDVRVIAATNKNLEQLIVERLFREDLFYRLNVIPLNTTPLREREDDIRPLSDYFVNRYSKIFNKHFPEIEEEFWLNLEKYCWPGNIRELQNTIEYVVNLTPSGSCITGQDIPDKIKLYISNISKDEMNIERLERELILKALNKYGFDGASKKIVAERLGIGIATLYRKLNKYGILSH